MITTNPSMLYPWPISLPPLHEVVSSPGCDCPRPTPRPACGDYSQKGASIKRVKRPLRYDCERRFFTKLEGDFLAGWRSDSFRLADHPFASWGVQVPDALPWERVQQITRAVQNQVVLVRNGSSQGPGHQSEPPDLQERAGWRWLVPRRFPRFGRCARVGHRGQQTTSLLSIRAACSWDRPLDTASPLLP